MTEPILPCLKDFAWPGRDDLARPLFTDAESDYIPWVAFGYDHPHTFEFLAQDMVAELGQTATEVERAAVRELRKRKASWEPWNLKLGLLKKLKMLACGDDFLAAERILDPVFMREGQRRLKAKALLVGVPRRGALMITDAQQDDDRIATFLALVCQQYSEGGSAPVSPAAFVVSDGRILSVVDAVARLTVPLETAETSDDDDDDDAFEEEGEDETYISRMLVTKDDRVTPIIVAVDSDFDRLADAVVQTVASTTAEFLSRKDFSGEIQVNIPSDTPQLDEKLPKLRAHLEGLVSELGSPGGHSVRVTVDTSKAASF